MDKREQFKFFCLVLSMTAGVAYSYGMFTLPFPSLTRKHMKGVREETKDNRTDGGTLPMPRPGPTLDILHSASTSSESSSSIEQLLE